MNYLPCPLCASTNLSDSTWCLDHGEVDAVECNDCYCGAPVAAWQKRWNTGEPPMSEDVLLTYRHPDGREIGPIVSMRLPDIESRPTVRWTHIPPDDRSAAVAASPARCEAPDLFDEEAEHAAR
jgi:hypothetical protein